MKTEYWVENSYDRELHSKVEPSYGKQRIIVDLNPPRTR